MGRKVLGLEITAKAMKVALVRNGSHPELLYCTVVNSPSALGSGLSDADAEISNIAISIKNIILRERILTKGVDSIAFCVNNPQTVVRNIKLPVLPNSELSAAVEYELSQSFPGVVATHIISFKEYSRDKKQINGIVSFSPRKTLDTYRKLIDAIDYKNCYIDVIANSEAKAFTALTAEGKKGGVFLLCDIGSTGTQFTIVEGKKVLHSRQIPDGDQPLREIFCDKLGIKPAEYEELWKTDPQKLNIDTASLASVFRVVYTNIVEQLRQTIDFYNSDSDGKTPISGIYLVGGGSSFPSIDEHFSTNIGLPVSILRPADKVKADRILFARAFSAIGAAIRED